MDINAYLNKRGWSGIDSNFRTKIDTEWMSWYQGDVETFHHYSIYNGMKYVERRRKTLNMAKAICEDWANLLMNEKVQISVGAFQKQFDEILNSNRWQYQINRLVELYFALGTGALVEYVGSDGHPNIDYIRADMIYPLSWENGTITECAFGSIKMIDHLECVYLQLHLKTPTGYLIENHLFDDKTGEELYPDDIESEITVSSPTPMFQIITPNISNNADLDCPMGISVFANAVSVLQAIDLKYDSYCNEFDLGRKRIILPISMLRIQDTANNPNERVFNPVFDSQDIVFYALPEGVEPGDGKPIEINMTLRTAEHKTAIQDSLNMLSLKCGMGTDRYSFETGGVKTATEVVSEKSDLFQNLKKHEHILTDAIEGMVKSLAYLCGVKEPTVTVMYDDGIINDDNTKIDNNIKLVQAELKSKLSAIMDIYGYNEVEAQKEYDRIVEENRGISGSDVDLFGQDSADAGEDDANKTEQDDEE